MKHYLITIRAYQVKKYVNKQDIQSVIEWLKLGIPSLKIIIDAYEIDSKYLQLHFHAWITTDVAIKYSTCSSHGAFRVYWRSMHNQALIPLINYLRKQDTDKYKRSQLLDENYFRYHYALAA